MKHTTDRWSCVAESFEEREDRYDDLVNKDPKIREWSKRIVGCIGCTERAMAKGGCSPEDIETLGELDDMIVNLVADVITCLAKESHAETTRLVKESDIKINLAFEAGRLFEQMLLQKEDLDKE